MRSRLSIEREAAADPEAAIIKALMSKRKAALKTAIMAREEFAKWFHENVGPDIVWTDPATNWLFNGWVADCGITEWLTEEDKIERDRRKAHEADLAERRRIRQRMTPEEKEAAQRLRDLEKQEKIEAKLAKKRARLTALKAATAAKLKALPKKEKKAKKVKL